MANFSKFAKLVHDRFTALSKHELFVTIDDTDELWDFYLRAFPDGTNPIFRERTEHDCSCCKQFVRNIGNVVAIVDGKYQSVWDIEGAEYPYNDVAKAMSRVVKSYPVSSLFRVSERRFGVEQNFELRDGVPFKWNHFHGKIADKHFTQSVGTDRGDFNTTVAVFKRGLEDLAPSAFETVIDLIGDKALYRGEEFLAGLIGFQALQRKYLSLDSNVTEQHLFVITNATDPATRFRNTAMGTLIQDLSAGMDLEAAVRSFEAKVAPTNYKRPTALITPRMVQDAMTTIQELDLEPALERRFAKLSDVSVSNVLWVDNSVQSQMRDGIEGLLMGAATAPKAASKLKPEEIGIEAFMASVVPQATSMDVFVRNAQQSNFMSLTAPANPDTSKLFKWDNDFAWSYDGNIADSIKEKVKRAGGNTNAPLRVSLAWFNSDDLDIHIQEPDRNHIYYGNKCGKLDVDMNAGGSRNAIDPVENVSWIHPKDGEYHIEVNQFSRRNNDKFGFVIEVENNGTVAQYSYSQRVSGTVKVGTIVVRNGQIVETRFSSEMVGGGISQEKWGVPTESFVKVNTLMFSPNHWDTNAVGNKHWFFILDGCLNDEPARGIYNEFLNSDLEKHRKVFEILGNKTKCQPTDQQLSGLGFSSTRGDSVLVQVTSNNRRQTYNITF